jgi:hypothetical protein
MILGPINGVDCLAFVVFLVPQLIYRVDLSELFLVLLKVIPFLGMLRAYRDPSDYSPVV